MKNNLYYLLIPGMFLCLILIVSFYPNKQYVPPLEPTKPVDTKGVDLPICQYGEGFVRYDSVKYLDLIIKKNHLRIDQVYPPYSDSVLKSLITNCDEVNIYADTNCTTQIRNFIKNKVSVYHDLTINYIVKSKAGDVLKLKELVTGHYGETYGCILYKWRNIFEILINAQGRVMVEKKPFHVDSIFSETRRFYQYGDSYYSDWLRIEQLELLEKDYNRFKNALIYYEDDVRYQDSLKEWKKRIEIFNFVGPFQLISRKACVNIQTDNSTNYGAFVKVLEEIEKARQSLIDELIRDRFKMSRSLFELIHTKHEMELLNEVYPLMNKLRFEPHPPVYPRMVVPKENL